jgi:hypothetical protein
VARGTSAAAMRPAGQRSATDEVSCGKVVAKATAMAPPCAAMRTCVRREGRGGPWRRRRCMRRASRRAAEGGRAGTCTALCRASRQGRRSTRDPTSLRRGERRCAGSGGLDEPYTRTRYPLSTRPRAVYSHMIDGVEIPCTSTTCIPQRTIHVNPDEPTRTRFPSSGPNTQYRVLPCGSSTYAPPGKKSSG